MPTTITIIIDGDNPADVDQEARDLGETIYTFAGFATDGVSITYETTVARSCGSCATALDDEGYCTDVGCSRCGKASGSCRACNQRDATPDADDGLCSECAADGAR